MRLLGLDALPTEEWGSPTPPANFPTPHPSTVTYQIQEGGLIFARSNYIYRQVWAGVWEDQETKAKFVPSPRPSVHVWSQFLPASFKELEKSFAGLTDLQK